MVHNFPLRNAGPYLKKVKEIAVNNKRMPGAEMDWDL